MFLQQAACAAVFAPLAGCDSGGGAAVRPDKIWGERGITPGKLQKPRAMCIDREDRLYLVDVTARIQVFDLEGNLLNGWRTPKSKNGRPTGMSIIGDKLYVADTHYFRVLVYSLQGKLLRQIGTGLPPVKQGELGWTTDVVQDSSGNLYISEYGQHDQIQKFDPDGTFVLQWGTHGGEPGQFLRPQNMWVDASDQIWVCDAGNHRLQVFNTDGEFLKQWGQEGIEPGQLSYPYCMWIDDQENVLVCEYGASRVQKLSQQGLSLGIWGSQGRAPGQLHNPWAIVQDSRGATYVLDSYNHRVQKFTI